MRPTPDPERERIIVGMFGDGIPKEAIARELQVGVGAVDGALTRAGVEHRRKTPSRAKWDG